MRIIDLAPSIEFDKYIASQDQSFENCINSGLEKICGIFNVQAASIYMNLCTADLALCSIKGKDKQGNVIPYIEASSIPLDFILTHLEEHSEYAYLTNPNIKELEIWNKTIGDINNIVLCPIYGQKRIVGLLILFNINFEIENKTFFANLLRAVSKFSVAISFQLRKEILCVIRDIKTKSLKVSIGQATIEDFVGYCVDKIGKSELLNYSFCSIRLYDHNHEIELEKKGYTNNVMMDEYIETTKHFQCYASYRHKETVYADDLDNANISFGNGKWITINNFKAYACVPIYTEDKGIGTISIFIPYKYNFYSFDKFFLEIISQEVASAVITSRYIEQITHNATSTSTRHQIDVDEASEHLHEHKNDLIAVKKIFQDLTKHENWESAKREIIRQKKRWDDKSEDLRKVLLENNRGQEGIFSLSSLMGEIVKYYDVEIRASDINIIIDVGNIEFKANKPRIFEAISNIIHNAIKSITYSDKKEKEIKVSAYLDTTDKIIHYYIISITDNGIGLDDKHKKTIFEKGNSKFKKGGGTGLGLYYSNKVVLDHGGSIWFESSPDEYTTFYLQFWKDYVS